MKAKVTSTRAFRLTEPKLECFEWFLFPARADHLNKSRRPADQRGATCRLMRVLRRSAHERQIDMHMRVDKTGEDILSCRVNNLTLVRHIQIPADACDRLVLAVNIRDVALLRRNNLAVLN